MDDLETESIAGDGDGPLVLLVLDGAASSTHALPAAGFVVIGRAKECDVTIDHVSISRRHARLRVGAAIAVEDLGSRNGTVVRGVRLAPNRGSRIG